MNTRYLSVSIPFSVLCVALVSCSSEDTPDGSTSSGATGGTGLEGATGGSVVTGGMIATGGIAGTGATLPATGGANPNTGGMQPGTGGAVPGTGGTGGIDATGGVSATGGVTLTGGVGVTGGIGASGGMGGTGAMGGSGGAGASGATGGVVATGGVPTGGVGATQGTGGSPEPVVHVYLALGQSNMKGGGFIPDEPVFHERVQILQGQNCPASDGNPYGYGEWREQFPPAIGCSDGTREKPDGSMALIGLTPADSFAVTMAEAAGPNVTIGIAGAAYGGTPIEAHLPNCADYGACAPPFGDISGAPVVNGTTPIYEWALDLGRRAQEVGVIKGIIFHQGESSSGQQNWPQLVNEYISSLRSDLNLDPSEVPFIAGELPYTGCCASHNELVHQIPDYVENGHWVSAGPMEDGTVLDDRGDGLHWSTFSVIEMGKRYAAKMLEVGNY
jgi:hypothetical protein